MAELAGGSTHTEVIFDSSLASVDRAEELALEAARLGGLDENSQHDVGISIREAMVNAVAHGNRYHGRKKVRFQLWRDERSMTIEIEDEGDGFEAGGVPDPREEANLMRHSGRGLLMMRAFMDEVDIARREPKGTKVRLRKNFPPGG